MHKDSYLNHLQGWTGYDTGGGCMALMRIYQRQVVLLTDASGSAIPETDDQTPCLLGLYSRNPDTGEWAELEDAATDYPSVREALDDLEAMEARFGKLLRPYTVAGVYGNTYEVFCDHVLAATVRDALVETVRRRDDCGIAGVFAGHIRDLSAKENFDDL